MSPRRRPRCGGYALRVVLDTNIWVSGLIAPEGAPGRILEAVRARRLTALVTWELAEEIAEVLERPRLAKYEVSPEDVADLLTIIGPLIPPVDFEVTPRDPDDAHVVAAAVVTEADALVTGDRGLLTDPALRSWLAERGIQLLSAAELLELVDPAP